MGRSERGNIRGFGTGDFETSFGPEFFNDLGFYFRLGTGPKRTVNGTGQDLSCGNAARPAVRAATPPAKDSPVFPQAGEAL